MNLIIPEDVVFRDLAGEAVILNISNGTYYGLNAMGTQIWQMISDGKAYDEIVTILLEEYEIDELGVRADLDHLLSQLKQAGLVILNERSGQPS